MNGARRWVLAAAAAVLALTGCAEPAVEGSRLREPALDPAVWFAGDTYAYGLFEGDGHAAKFGFRTWLRGSPTPDGFTLRERFSYDDGLKWERTWRFRRSGPGAWTATADNVVGAGRMTTAGDAARIVYDADMPQAPGKTLRLHFDMALNRLGEGMVVNRAFVSKFGLPVGRLTMVFVKPGARWPEASAIAGEPPYPIPR